jgi:hypothetical protein
MSSNRYRYAIIGTGRPHGTEGATGWRVALQEYSPVYAG